MSLYKFHVSPADNICVLTTLIGVLLLAQLVKMSLYKFHVSPADNICVLTTLIGVLLLAQLVKMSHLPSHAPKLTVILLNLLLWQSLTLSIFWISVTMYELSTRSITLCISNNRCMIIKELIVWALPTTVDIIWNMYKIEKATKLRSFRNVSWSNCLNDHCDSFCFFI